jgi:CSLREA domain-containing protein/uncharacterized repeat protein (TIGR01451 family)
MNSATVRIGKELLLAIFGMLFLPCTLLAATITVNTTADANGLSPDGTCALREAILAANTDKPVDGCAPGSGDDTILLPAGTYTLTIPGADENAGMTGDLDIIGNVTLIGDGTNSTIIDGSGIDRVLHIDPACSGIVTEISGVTVRNGETPDSMDDVKRNGGGINNCGKLIISDAVVSGNRTFNIGAGGGIFNQGKGVLIGTNIAVKNNSQAITGAGIGNAGTLMLTNSTIEGNATWYAVSSGGGVGNSGDATLVNVAVSNNTALGSGAGISNTGQLRLVNSTVNNNMAVNYYGGGAANDSVLDVINSTISGNTARTAGGGIWNSNLMSMANATVANNTVMSGMGGGIYIYNQGILDIENSLLAYNAAAGGKNNCVAPAGSISSYGYNLEDADTCGLAAVGDKTGIDPLLGPLQDNGGMTFTHALLAGSPAIDAGNPAGCKAEGGTRNLLNDQRSFLRPKDGDGNGSAVCDPGAYEFSGVPLPGSDLSILAWGSPNPVALGGALTYNLLVTNNGPQMADGVVITTSLPQNVTFMSSSINNGTCVGSNPVTCYVGCMFAAETVMPAIVVKPTVAGMISSNFTVVSTTPDPSLSNNNTIVNTLTAEILPVRRVAGSITVGSYSALQPAFDASRNDDLIEAMATVFNEKLTIDSRNSTTLTGGYNADFATRVGYTTIDGTLIIKSGTLTVDHVKIK